MVENLSEFVWIGKRGEKIQMLLSHCVFNSLLDIGCMIFPSLKFFFSFRVWYILSQLVSRCFVAFGSFLYVFLIRIRVYCYLFLGLLCMNECYFFFVVDDNTKLDTFVLNNSLWRYTFTKTTFWLETMTSCIYMYTLFFFYILLLVRYLGSSFFFLVTNILSPLRIRDKHHLESFHLLLCFALTLEQTRNNNTKSREKKIIFINEVL